MKNNRRLTDSKALGLSNEKGRVVIDGDEGGIPGVWLAGTWSFNLVMLNWRMTQKCRNLELLLNI